MKILSKNIMLCIAILSFLIMGCEDDLPTNNYSNNNPVTFTVHGKVINENGNIISNARISLNGQEVYTNHLGLYLFKDIEIAGSGAFLKVDKDGYFNSGRRIQAKDASVKKIDIQLLQETWGGSFSSSAGGEVTLNNDGLKIEFQADGFVDENGNPYTGNVGVEYTFISVENENLVNIAPGGLSAINTAGEEVILASYGMIGVELNGGNVNLAEGYTAKITLPIANEFLADAPSTIPLWHLNEETGFWEEEGTATLQGNTYVGDVSHFSFWNCDAPFPLVELSFQIVGENNNPVASEYIYASINNNGVTSGGITDDNGYVTGKFPKDEVIQLSMGINNNCSSASYFLNQDIGPFQENTDAGIFVETLQNEETIQIQATIDNSCANNNTDGYFLIVKSNANTNCSWEFYIDDNNFDVQFQGNSADSYTAIMYDAANFTSSDEYALDMSLNNIGMISVCENSGEYVILQIENGEEINFFVEGSGEGLSHDLVNFQIGPIDSTLILIDFSSEFQSEINFKIEYTDVNDKLGTSSLNNIYFYTQSYYLYCNDPCSEQTLTLNEFGNSGEYLSGTISGVLGNNQQTNNNYTMDFRFKIE